MYTIYMQIHTFNHMNQFESPRKLYGGIKKNELDYHSAIAVG